MGPQRDRAFSVSAIILIIIVRLAMSFCRESISKFYRVYVHIYNVLLRLLLLKWGSVLLLFVLRTDELLRDYGTSLGQKDADRSNFFTEQHVIPRDERHAKIELGNIRVNSQAENNKEILNVELEREKLKDDDERRTIVKSSESFEETKVKGLGHDHCQCQRQGTFLSLLC